ncbi:hypothetical protein [Siphonobacter sp. SORGH_AS_1065]|uniref:hypothetical protein n=1 Tax=Siphonobacter sp. SORGH_AS_1065 TaxID=3041795 RepID=UPI002783A0E1|nr:hypothetical protein [Siphonobacter sp. SORGH_AS_1065]MDQ1086221.1 hypothetical protein [Siphonobacter sp. SORGH_AS_1065]
METIQIGDQVIHKPKNQDSILNGGEPMVVAGIEEEMAMCQTLDVTLRIPLDELIKTTDAIPGFVG